MKEQYLSEKDLHCIARLVQSSFQAPKQESIDTSRQFYGCMYCKYAVSDCDKPDKPDKFNFKKVFKKLEELTGVNISTWNPPPEQLGMVFLPASHYLEHPEDMHYLENIHDHNTVESIKSCMDTVISRSKEMSGQKQDIDCLVCNQKNTNILQSPAATGERSRMKEGIPGYVSNFELRQGGYINFQYHDECPSANDQKYMLTKEETRAMLADANAWIQKYFPWTEDFVVFQLRDGTIRLDASREGFLS